jgi:hypothetical protein
MIDKLRREPSKKLRGKFMGKHSFWLRIVVSVWLAVVGQRVWAWGPHPEITQAALDVLPNLAEARERLGEENIKALLRHCWLPDHRGRDLGSYYADDYLLMPAVPFHVSHVMPHVQEIFEPYFRRALQALRTESPTNAARQIGPILHFVEDVGAPPHAKPNCPHHGDLENWVKADLINIRGYEPQLLGKNEDEAVQGLLRRIAGLVAFSAERAERALAVHPDREKVEPIILESALETARVTADLLYTLFVLGFQENPNASQLATLTVTIQAPRIPHNNDQEPRVVLLGTNYSTNAEAEPEEGIGVWRGVARFRNLPPGSYQVLAYRPGALSASATVELVAGENTEIGLELKPTDPAGNLVYNPDTSLSTLGNGQPDRWQRVPQRIGQVWDSAVVPLQPGAKYELGVRLKKLDGPRVLFLLTTVPPGQPQSAATTQRIVLWPAEGKSLPESIHLHLGQDLGSCSLRVQIGSGQEEELGDILEKVWIVRIP